MKRIAHKSFHLWSDTYTDAGHTPLCKCACVRCALRKHAPASLSHPRSSGCAPSPHFLARAATTPASVTMRGIMHMPVPLQSIKYSLRRRCICGLRSRPSAVPSQTDCSSGHGGAEWGPLQLVLSWQQIFANSVTDAHAMYALAFAYLKLLAYVWTACY